jgi:hypothetical protein
VTASEIPECRKTAQYDAAIRAMAICRSADAGNAGALTRDPLWHDRQRADPHPLWHERQRADPRPLWHER